MRQEGKAKDATHLPSPRGYDEEELKDISVLVEKNLLT